MVYDIMCHMCKFYSMLQGGGCHCGGERAASAASMERFESFVRSKTTKQLRLQLQTHSIGKQPVRRCGFEPLSEVACIYNYTYIWHSPGHPHPPPPGDGHGSLPRPLWEWVGWLWMGGNAG